MSAADHVGAGNRSSSRMGFVEDWLEQFVKSWNEHEPGQVADLCTADVAVSDPSLPLGLRGRESVHHLVESTLRAFPDFRVCDVRAPLLAADPPSALVEYTMTGTMLGEWEELGFAATGRAIAVPAIDRYEFRDELLCECRTTYDSLGVARQLGILPPTGSRADRLLVRAQRVQARLQRHLPRARATTRQQTP